MKLVAVMLTLLGCGGAAAEETLSKAAIQDRALRASAWIVALSLRESGRTTTGTVFLVDSRAGLVVSNAHVGGDKKQVRVMFPWYRGGQVATDRKFYGREMPLEGEVLALDRARDLALIKVPNVPTGVRPLKLAETSTAGENVYVVGNPKDPNLWRTNEATIKSVAVRNVAVRDGPPVTDAAIADLLGRDEFRKGFSGGPVLNARGELVGILFGGGVPDAHAGLAIEVREIRDVIVLVRQYPTRAQAVLTPRTVADYHDRGSYYLGRNQYERAIASLNKAIELQDPPSPRLSYLRGVALRKQGDAHAALADLTETLRRDNKDRPAYRERGAAWLLAGDCDRAIADFGEAIRLNPQDAQAYAGRSQAYTKKGAAEQAKSDWLKALQLDPTLEKPS